MTLKVKLYEKKMMNELFYVVESSIGLMVRRRRRSGITGWVNQNIPNKSTRSMGNYTILTDGREKNPEKFSDYFRTMNSFTYILESVKSKLKKYSDFRRIISPEHTKSYGA